MTVFISSIDKNQMASSRICVNDPDNFCYTCGEFIPKANRKLISDFYKNAYRAYFQVELGDQDKKCVPHIVCKTCLENIRLWTSGKLKSLRHAIPKIWREPQNHFSDRYFCSVSIAGLNQKKRTSVTNPSLPSAIRPVQHSDELPVPVFQKDRYTKHDESDSDVIDEHFGYDPDFVQESVPETFSQSELNDLVRELSLSKESAELLASRVNEKHLLARDTKVTFYRNRDAELIPFFEENDDLVFCTNTENVLLCLDIQA